MYFRGPERYVHSSDTWIPYRWPDILAAEIDVCGEQIPLRENVLCVVGKPPAKAYVWLTFNTDETNGGRWYNKRCPIEFLHLYEGTCLAIPTHYAEYPAWLRVRFSEAGATRFRAVLAALVVPPTGDSGTP